MRCVRGAGAVLLATASALALAGCGSSGAGHGGRGTAGAGDGCLWEIVYGGRTYQHLAVGRATHHAGSPLGQAHFPGCADSGGTGKGDAVTVYRIAGVPPAEAVITQGDQIGVADPSHLPPGVRALLTPPPS
jgi:hypothetical protein